MMETPMMHTTAPTQSYTSGVFLSTPHPHSTASTTKTPPYAAYTRPNDGNDCSVGTMPYKTKMPPPTTPYHIGFDSRSHNHTKYPPPISAKPARMNRTMARSNWFRLPSC